MKHFTFFFAMLAMCSSAFGQSKIELADISRHIGDSVTVEGKIRGVSYLQSAKDSPTFISVGERYPNQLLTILIWGSVRDKMKHQPSDEEDRGGMVKVSGTVLLYKGKPEIIVYEPQQLVITPADIKIDLGN